MYNPSNTAVLEPEPTRDETAKTVAFFPRLWRLVPLLCCLGLLAALAWPMFAGKVYVADDLGAFHLPLRAFYSQQLAAGEAFDWNPEMFAGFYLSGEGQAGTYHPLHLLLYRFLPLQTAFDLECLLSYPFMLAGMYLFLRRWRMGRSEALFGAMVFTFGGFNLLHFVHPNVVAIVAHLTWLLVAIDVMLRGNHARARRLSFASIALLTGSQLLLGSPQFVMFSLMLEAGYVLWLGGFAGTWRWVLAIGIGCLIGGIQLLPTVDALQHSVRHSAKSNFATQGSLYPLNLMQLVAPYLFQSRVVGQNTHELGLYIGAAPLVLAVWWLISGQIKSRRRLTMFACATAALAILWALGSSGPMGWFEAHLPIVNRFRFPCRAIVLFQLAIAALAALGFTVLARPAGSHVSTKRLWWLPALSAAAAFIGLICCPANVAAWPLIVAGPALFAVAVWLAVTAADGSRWALAAIVIFAAADLGIYGTTYSIIGKTSDLADFARAADAPPGPVNGRVAIDLMSGTESANGEHGQRVGDQVLLAGWKSIDGYLGLEPARQLNYREPAALRAAGATWLSAQADANVNPAASKNSNSWIAIANAQPRARLVTLAIVSENPAAEITRISLANEALVDRPLPSQLSESAPGAVNIVLDRPGRIELNTKATGDQFLVVNESHHDGWQATLDGKNVSVFRANGDFLGLLVPAGDHEITLEFSPKSLDLGRLITQFGLGLIGVIVFWPQSAEAQLPAAS